MRKIKIIFQLILFTMIIFICSKVNAASITLSSNKSTVNVGDEFTISMNLSGARVASLNSRVTIDTTKVQYVSSNAPSNTNFNNGRILYTWTDNSGGSNPKTDGTIVTFTLKSISAGTANFSISGSFYDSNENKIDMNLSGANVTIKEKVIEQPNTNPETPPTTEPETPPNTTPETPPTTEPETLPNTNTEIPPTTEPETPVTPPSNQETPNQTGNNEQQNLSSNANLSSLHVNVEGISPSFNKNTTRYYLIVDNSINEIKVTAKPEDNNAKVNIQGNTNLQTGSNTIAIAVTAQDNITKKIYYINVTKTNDPNDANTNLENLAIENVTLNPEFNADILEYSAKVGSDIETLNILAVPQIEGANVKITGGDKLAFGYNTITVTVTAKDGVSTKIYNVSVYRMTENEEIEEQNRLLDEQNNMNDNDNIISKQELNDYAQKNNNTFLWIIFWILIVVIIGIVIYLIWSKKIKKG